MVTLIATFQVKEGKMDEVIEKLKEVAPHVRKSEKGCIKYVPHTVKGKTNKNTIIFYEKYEDFDAVSIHMANLSENFKDIFPLLEEFDMKRDLKTCEEII